MVQRTMEIDGFISPFSHHHFDWKLNWKVIPSNKKYDRPNENRTMKEEKILESVASVGVIGGLQIKNLFKANKDHLQSLERRNLLVRHELKKDDREIPIYTVGKYGANKIMPEYRENYWLEMNTVQVLKCLSFFQFCQLFDDPEIIPAPEPFTAGIRLNDKPFYVYVERNGIKDLLLFLKWKKMFKERIFIITERLEYIEEIKIFMEQEMPLMLRVILDEQLKKREFTLYHYEQNHPDKWIKD